jgi:hypothetical protein
MSEWYNNWLIPSDLVTIVPMEKPVSFKKVMGRNYSFIKESKSYPSFCTEEDCEMIPFSKVAKDIQNSSSEDDVTGDIRNAIDYLENDYTRSNSFKNLPELKQKFLKEIIKVFKEHVSHLMCLDSWCGYIAKDRWVKCFAPDYVKHVVNCIKRGRIV